MVISLRTGEAQRQLQFFANRHIGADQTDHAAVNTGGCITKSGRVRRSPGRLFSNLPGAYKIFLLVVETRLGGLRRILAGRCRGRSRMQSVILVSAADMDMFKLPGDWLQCFDQIVEH